MRKFLAHFFSLTLIGTICTAQVPARSDNGSSGPTAQQPQHLGAREQDPTVPQQPADAADAQQAPASPDAPQEPVAQQDRTPELKARPEPVRTIPANRTLNAGTEIRASLDRVISSKSSQAGDEFTATLMEPLMNPEGQILVHSRARIHGRIAGIERGKLFGSLRNASARLNLRFTDLEFENGGPLPIEASLVGISESSAKTKAKSNEEGDISSGGGSGKETAHDIGVGAGAGTLVGLVLGSAWKGAIFGALAGGGYVLANQGRDVELPTGTGLRIRLDKYLTVPEYALRPDAGTPPPAADDTHQTGAPPRD